MGIKQSLIRETSGSRPRNQSSISKRIKNTNITPTEKRQKNDRSDPSEDSNSKYSSKVESPTFDKEDNKDKHANILKSDSDNNNEKKANINTNNNYLDSYFK